MFRHDCTNRRAAIACAHALALAMLSLVTSAHGSNTPYPGVEESGQTIYYSSFSQPPNDLDPQRAYSAGDALFLSFCYERLLVYHYLKRPIELMPELATALPRAEPLHDADGNPAGVRYRFNLQRGVTFIDDPCFPDGKGRELCILRPIHSERAMTATAARLPLELLVELEESIMALPGISGLAYDLTSKPPGTIEWE